MQLVQLSNYPLHFRWRPQLYYAKDWNFLNQCLGRVRATPVDRGEPVIPATPVVKGSTWIVLGDSICTNQVCTKTWRVAFATSCHTERQLPAQDTVRLHEAPKARGRADEFDCNQPRPNRLGNQYSCLLDQESKFTNPGIVTNYMVLLIHYIHGALISCNHHIYESIFEK